MRRGGHARARVFDKYDAIAKFVRGTSRPFDAEVRHHAGKNDRAHLSSAEVEVERRAVEGRPLMLRDHQIVDVQLRFNLVAACVRSVRIDRAHEHDREPAATKRACEPFNAADHLRSRVRGGALRDHPPLKIHDDQSMIRDIHAARSVASADGARLAGSGLVRIGLDRVRCSGYGPRVLYLRRCSTPIGDLTLVASPVGMRQLLWAERPKPASAIVASPFVVFERDEVSSVAGLPPFNEASEQATAGAKRPM